MPNSTSLLYKSYKLGSLISITYSNRLIVDIALVVNIDDSID